MTNLISHTKIKMINSNLISQYVVVYAVSIFIVLKLSRPVDLGNNVGVIKRFQGVILCSNTIYQLSKDEVHLKNRTPMATTFNKNKYDK